MNFRRMIALRNKTVANAFPLSFDNTNAVFLKKDC